MPDPYRNEEIENRTLSLFLFNVASIIVLNRCAHCPGAARAAIQHRRCPREPLQPNIFRPEVPDSKIRGALKSLASSSKQLESASSQETVAVLPNEFARLSLVDSERTTGTSVRSDSDPDPLGTNAEVSEIPRISQGVKRKAKLEDREEECKYRKNRVDVTTQEYLKLRPLNKFRDLESGNLFMPGCVRVPFDEMTALLMKCSSANPMEWERDHHPSGEASCSRPFVPGCCINTAVEGSGAFACNDGIETEGSEVLAFCDEMESEEP